MLHIVNGIFKFVYGIVQLPVVLRTMMDNVVCLTLRAIVVFRTHRCISELNRRQSKCMLHWRSLIPWGSLLHLSGHLKRSIAYRRYISCTVNLHHVHRGGHVIEFLF